MSVTAIIQGATGPGAVITAGSTIRVTVSPFGTSSGGAPSAHASTHASGGSDPVSIAASQITSGVIAPARLGTSSGNESTYLTGVASFASDIRFLYINDCGTDYISTDNNVEDVMVSIDRAIGNRALTTHTHGSITADGKLGTTANLLVGTGTGGTLGTVTLGTGLTLSSGVLSGTATYTLPTATSSVLGGVKIGSGISIDGSGVISASSGYTLPNATTSTLGGVIVGTGLSVTSGTVSVSYGASSSTACVGNDSRLSDSRAPNGSASGDLTGTYPSPTLAAVGTSGTYTKVTTDTKGRVTSGTTLGLTDMPTDVQNATRLYLWSSFR